MGGDGSVEALCLSAIGPLWEVKFAKVEHCCWVRME